MDATSENINQRTMKGKKLHYDYLHYEYKGVCTVISSSFKGKKFSMNEVNRPYLSLEELELGHYTHLARRIQNEELDYYQIDRVRMKEHLTQFYALNSEIECCYENNKPKRNLFIKLRQMFNDIRYDTSIIYYSGAANKSGYWIVESKEFGEEEMSFFDIYELWMNKTSKQKHLQIIIDSNYSGKWVKELTQINPKVTDVTIAAACKENEKAYTSQVGGFYTHNILKLLTKNSLENIALSNQTPQFGGDYLQAKKYTNLYLKFNNWQELSEFQKSDYVLIDYENGTYIGHFYNAQKHFWGVFLWKGGVFKDCKYLGEFRGGKLHGKGLLIYHNGRVYEGDFENNTPHGNAVETYPNGDKYIGQYYNGFKNGKGTYYYHNGEIYEGAFADNKPNGKGALKMPNGAIYEGTFKNGKCNGKGKFKYANGDIYEGEWLDSVKAGKGTYYYSNGNVYEGEFSGGVRHGFGKHTTPLGESYEGTWENDIKSGEGIFESSSGQKSTGEWVKGKIAQNTKFFSKKGTQKLTF